TPAPRHAVRARHAPPAARAALPQPAPRAAIIAAPAESVPPPPLPHITESPELIQIRADIAARKRRIDSLAQLVDSLRITSHATQPRATTPPSP
ncbi:MAG TPA: hypothetical protein VNW46_06515, partial [Gemmatimonadaceae bacterium]|nr:hypothetical protein [Gemmatimonadaceae bacterium]